MKIELLNARKSVAVGLIDSTGAPKAMLSNVIPVLSYTDQSARSCSVTLSMRRLIPDSASGSTPDRFPGFSPLPCTELPPVSHASSTRSRSAGFIRRGWNRNAVVATFLPLASTAQTSSRHAVRGV